MAILPTDTTAVHYAPAHYAPVCGALGRIMGAREDGELVIEYLQDSYNKTTSIYKVTCPLCLEDIVRVASVSLRRITKPQ